jgi:CheY-like chemotaxis protein
VKQLVEMHGGVIEARSEGLGRGSEFVVRLPLARSPAPTPGAEQEETAPHAAGALRILIADDNADAAASLGLMLRLKGHVVRTTNDGQAALEEADDYRPDVILLDIGMPRPNGLDVARRVRESRWGRGVALIAMTGWGQEADQARSREAGFDFHLVKPVGPAALERLLAGLLPGG